MTHPEKIRLVVADEQPVVLLGLQIWFEARGRYEVVASATRGEQLLAKLAAATSELIVMDCALDARARRGADRFATLRAVRERYPDTPVVALTSDTHPRTLREILCEGVEGVASAYDDLKELGRVCERVLSGVKGVTSRGIDACLAIRDEDSPAAFNSNMIYREVRVSVTSRTVM
jgi:DNA-binding NarL/FixJ family response regulator